MSGLPIRLKVGDTFEVLGTYKDDSGDAVDLLAAGIEVASSVASADGLEIYALTVTVDPNQVANTGKFHITGNTAAWQPGKGLQWDVRYTRTADGYSFSSDSNIINLGPRIS